MLSTKWVHVILRFIAIGFSVVDIYAILSALLNIANGKVKCGFLMPPI